MFLVWLVTGVHLCSLVPGQVHFTICSVVHCVVSLYRNAMYCFHCIVVHCVVYSFHCIVSLLGTSLPGCPARTVFVTDMSQCRAISL